MTSTNLANYNNKWFKPGANKIVQIVWYFTNVLVLINPLNPSSFIKTFTLRLFGAKIGRGVVIKPGVNIKYPWKLRIGNHTWIGENVWIDNLDWVIIGNNCCISQGALLLSGNHNYKSRLFNLMVNPIIIEDGVWIGAKSVVNGGVTCASHSVLSVMSVASNNLNAFTIYKGNPCIEIKKRVIS